MQKNKQSKVEKIRIKDRYLISNYISKYIYYQNISLFFYSKDLLQWLIIVSHNDQVLLCTAMHKRTSAKSLIYWVNENSG